MSAWKDYPLLAQLSRPVQGVLHNAHDEARRALDELDVLRALCRPEKPEVP